MVLLDNELKRMGRKRPWTNLKYYPAICLLGLGAHELSPSGYSAPRPRFKPDPPEYKLEAFPLHPNCSWRRFLVEKLRVTELVKVRYVGHCPEPYPPSPVIKHGKFVLSFNSIPINVCMNGK
jgi:hypothetical protein